MNVAGISLNGGQDDIIYESDHKLLIHRRDLLFHFPALSLHHHLFDGALTGDGWNNIFSEHLARYLVLVLIHWIGKSHNNFGAIFPNWQ